MLNKVIIKNRYLLPFINEIFNRLLGVIYFIKFNLKDNYHYIKIREGYEWKITFRIRYEYFKYLIISFGLINILVTF